MACSSDKRTRTVGYAAPVLNAGRLPKNAVALKVVNASNELEMELRWILEATMNTPWHENLRLVVDSRRNICAQGFHRSLRCCWIGLDYISLLCVSDVPLLVLLLPLFKSLVKPRSVSIQHSGVDSAVGF